MRASKCPSNIQELLDLTYETEWSGSPGEDTAVRNAKFAVEYFGPKAPIKSITYQKVEAYRRYLRKTHKNGPATINRKLAALGRMLTVALYSGSIRSKPVLKREMENSGRKRTLTHAEEVELFCELQNESRVYRDIAILLVDTGMRVNEILTLDWNSICLNPVAGRTPFVVVTPDKSKNSSLREIPLTDRAVRVLAQLRGRTSGPFVDVSYRSFNTAWNNAKLRLPWARRDGQVVPHCLRHTCATRLIRNGVDIAVVRLWMGHKNIAVTAGYTHPGSQEMDNAVRQLQHGGQ